jgi:phosphatidate cytidylyltransferase
MARILSALVLGPAVLAFVFFAPPLFFLIGIAAAGSLCLYEYFRMIGAMGFKGQPWFGHAALWLLLAGLHQKRIPAAAILAVILIAALLAALWRRDCTLRERAEGLMANLLGIFYLGFLLYPAAALRFDFGEKTGLHWMIVLLFTLWAGDSAALVVGKRFGRTPFAPQVSPKKTNEGAVGGLLAGIFAAVVLQQFLFPDLPLQHVVAVAFLAGIAGQMGDLAESMLKRAAEIKDSSRIIPGHGGALDRIDSLLFGFPVLYVYMLGLYS